VPEIGLGLDGRGVAGLRRRVLDGQARSGGWSGAQRFCWAAEIGAKNEAKGKFGGKRGWARRLRSQLERPRGEEQAGRTSPVGEDTRPGQAEGFSWIPGLASGPLESQGSCLLHQTAQGVQIAQEVGGGIFFARAGQAEAGHALEAQVLKRAVAALGHVAPPGALLPGGGGIRHLAGQAYGAVG
jgi:hypothetical protein